MKLARTSLEYVADLVYRRSGIVVGDDKDYLVISRLTPIARDEGHPDVDTLVNDLRRRRDAAVEARIIEAMTTNETTFFRDVHPFRTLQHQVLPALIEARRRQRKLAVWSAAASTGQEVYTLAIMLREHFSEVRQWDLSLQASDISCEVIDKARRGRYAQHEVNRGLPAALLLKYFRQDGRDWVIHDDIREMVTFREVNLIGSWPRDYPAFDLVLLRNVLIYFDEKTKVDILKRIHRRMTPQGVLMLGAAETTMGLDDTYERVTNGSTAYYRLRGHPAQREGEASDVARRLQAAG